MPQEQLLQSNPILAATVAKGIKVSTDKAKVALKAGTAKQEDIQQEISTASTAKQNAILKSAGAAQVVAKQKGVATLQAENVVLDQYNMQGGNEQLTELILNQRTAQAERDKTQGELNEIYDQETTGISLIDGIINGFAATRTEMEMDSDQQALDQANSAIAGFGATTETVARVQNLTKRTVNEATIEAEQAKIAADAQVLAQNAKLVSLQSNAQQVQRVMNASVQESEFDMQTYKAYERTEDRAMRVEQFAQSKKVMAFQVQQYERAKAKDEERTDLEDVQISAIQAAQGLLEGGTVEDTRIIRAALKEPGKLDDRYVKLREIGANILAGNEPVLATTPADAAIVEATITPAGSPPSEASKLHQTIAISLNETYSKPGVSRPKKTEGIKAAYNAHAETFMKTKAAKIVEGDTSNPYVAAPFSVIAETAAVQETPLFQKVLKEQNMVETSPDRILVAAIAGVQAKAVTPEQAAQGIVTIFNRAVAHNNAVKKFARSGLRVQDSYTAEFTIPGARDLLPTGLQTIFGKAVAADAAVADKLFGTALAQTTPLVDLTNYSQVQNLIVRYLAGSGNLAGMFGYAGTTKIPDEGAK